MAALAVQALRLFGGLMLSPAACDDGNMHFSASV